MFKSFTVYRIGAGWTAPMTEIKEKLHAGRFVECGATQEQSGGWVEPRGEAHGPLVESVGGQLMLKFQNEKKVLPGSVVKRKVDERARQVEAETGRKPGKKHAKELREQAVLELLPMAFTRQSAMVIWIDPDKHTLIAGTSSQARADEVITALVKALPGLVVTPVQTATSPAVAMAEWLSSREAPAGFTVDRECELKAGNEMKSVVRYTRHTLDIDEVVQHIAEGKLPTQLAMTWNDRVSFVLTEGLQVKKLSFLDVVFEGSGPDKEDGFDADVAITTGEMRQLIPDLLDALDGEAELGAFGTSDPAASGAPAPATSAAAAARTAAPAAPAAPDERKAADSPDTSDTSDTPDTAPDASRPPWE